MPIDPVVEGEIIETAWGNAVADAINALQALEVMTTRGDLIVRGAAGPERLPLATMAGGILGRNGTDPVWRSPIDLALSSVLFPAAQISSANANSLDDYEESNWTPGVTFGGNAVGLTTSTAMATCVKVGRLVLYSGVIVMTAKGSSAGIARITGLPFPVPNVYSVRGEGTAPEWASMATIAAGIFYAADPNTSTLLIRTGGASGSINLTEANFTNTTQLYLGGFYFAAT